MKHSALLLLLTTAALAADLQLPDSKWKVHDEKRPLPKDVTPGANSSQDLAGKAPSDAIVLFDGKDLVQWVDVKSGAEPKWKVENGIAVGGGGDIQTKEAYGDMQLHVEWAAPAERNATLFNRGNSGVYIMGLYEIQIFDSYKDGVYADGNAGSVYGQFPPLVNASRAPGQWQTFDILFIAPRFDKDGKLESPARVTLLHNGVLVHNHVEVLGRTGHKLAPEYKAHEPKLPLRLQDHGDAVRFRNVWVRPLKGYDE